jgi:glycosyltransferase involved in cell wall biosynthesis
VFRLATLFADRVVCVSGDSMRLSAAEGVAARRLAVIRNGIDTSRFAYLGPSPGGPVVVVGRLVPAKGVDTLLRAAARVVRTRPDFRVEIAGDGEARPGLERLSAELGLGECVRFLGTVRDVPGLLGRASALALPSLSEGISLTLLEAMARGLPVVAARVGGNPEVVDDGVTGRLVPAGDPDRLAEQLLDVWPVSDRTRAMGRAGRERVERLFDVRRMVAEYEAMYLRLTRRANGRRAAAVGTAD